MVRRGVASTGAMVALVAIALASCGRSSREEPRSIELSGPIGTEHSVHPRHETTGWTILRGCCCFDTSSARVIRLEGDVEGRRIEGDGFWIEVSFGNGIA